MICDFSNFATVSLERITALMRSAKRLNSTGMACSATCLGEIAQSKSISRTEKKSRLRCPRRTARPRISQNGPGHQAGDGIERSRRDAALHVMAAERMAQDAAKAAVVQLGQRQHIGGAGVDQFTLDFGDELGRQDNQRSDRILPHQRTDGSGRRDAIVAIEHEDSAIEIGEVLGRRSTVGSGHELDVRARTVGAGLADQIDGRRRSRNQHDR